MCCAGLAAVSDAVSETEDRQAQRRNAQVEASLHLVHLAQQEQLRRELVVIGGQGVVRRRIASMLELNEQRQRENEKALSREIDRLERLQMRTKF
jgi:hypothetical protein